MPKAKATDVNDFLTPEQRVEGESFADLYFLAVPRQTLEVLNKEAKARGLSLSQALSQAVERWLAGGSNG